MLDKVIKILELLWVPWIIIILTIIIGWAFYITYKLWVRSHKITWVDTIQITLWKINENISEIKWSINNINARLDRNESRIFTLETSWCASRWDSFAAAHSPMQLTPKWEKVLQWSNIEEILKSNIKDIYEKYPKLWDESHPFDIQTLCMSYALDIFQDFVPEEVRDLIKNNIYLEWWSLWHLNIILRVTLRDVIFQEKDIHIDDLEEKNT